MNLSVVKPLTKPSPYSSVDGSQGWIGSLIEMVGGVVQGGFKYGETKLATQAATAQAQIAGNAAVLGAGYGAIGAGTSDEILAAALGNSANANRQKPSDEGITKNIVTIAIIAAVALVAIVVVFKSDQTK